MGKLKQKTARAGAVTHTCNGGFRHAGDLNAAERLAFAKGELLLTIRPEPIFATKQVPLLRVLWEDPSRERYVVIDGVRRRRPETLPWHRRMSPVPQRMAA